MEQVASNPESINNDTLLDKMRVDDIQQMLDLAAKYISRNEFDEATSQILKLLDSLKTIESIKTLQDSMDFQDLLFDLFHKSRDHLQYIFPKIDQLFCVTLGQHYFHIKTSYGGCHTSTDISKLDYNDGLKVVQSLPSKSPTEFGCNDDDIIDAYLELAELHGCVEKIAERTC